MQNSASNNGGRYPEGLVESAEAANVNSWRFAHQSVGQTGRAWLGPDILDNIQKISRQGKKNILVVPFGFVCGHLEMFFDINIEAVDGAEYLGGSVARVKILFGLVTTGRDARISNRNVA